MVKFPHQKDYIIVEKFGDLSQVNTPTLSRIRGIYSTQAKALAELTELAQSQQQTGTNWAASNNHKEQFTITELIADNTTNGETSIVGYNQDTLHLVELKIIPTYLDVWSLILI